MKQITLSISQQAYATLQAALVESDDTRTVEQVLESELTTPEVLIEMLGWDNC